MRALTPSFAAVFAVALAGTAGAQDLTLRLPIACEVGKTCFVQHYVDADPSPATKDYRCGTLTYDGHNGTDIRLPTMAAQKAGVDVLAAADGTVLVARDAIPDISVADQGRDKVKNLECGNGAVVDHGNGWQTQYCHLAKDSVVVRTGDRIKAGDRIGRVGLSGLTEFPHVHFTVRKDSKIVDPFAYGAAQGSCGGGKSLWDDVSRVALAYEAGSVLNKGFASGPVAMEAIESGTAGQDVPTTKAPALVAFVRAIGLKGGDEQVLTLFDPDGKALAQNKAPALDRDKAQVMLFSGVKQPDGGFRPGLYRAVYRVMRDGKPAIEQAFGMALRP
ncbi:M23 family metallopeptidase [Microvirga sp. 2MCAF38]|uniref:M23 family metallopeptidase n=1 Tax=Microvirga sp. 2MCAF38 TaxID=3232989 RepID=UPI003F9A02A0